ncbi:MAG: cobalt ECF transporter T component CbiQ [Thermodesulfobacteriota bacterium]
MAKIDAAAFDITFLETLAQRDTPVHRLDPRAKLLVTAAFVLAVVSADKYAISGLLIFLLYPVAMVGLADLPARYLAGKVLLVMPFALLVGAFNPLLDRQVLVVIGPVEIAGGWISFVSIVLRSLLTVSAALILIATSGFPSICLALERLHVPRMFTIQLLFLYRYLFVLAGEARRMVRARALRSFGRRGLGPQVAASLMGHLLLRTLARARRIHLAMLCRGFDGEIRILRQLRLSGRDAVFVLAWSGLFLLLRLCNVPLLLGGLLAG